MVLPVEQFNPLTPQQASPLMTGLNLMQGFRQRQLQNQAQATQNQFMQPSLQQKLQAQIMTNKLAQQRIPLMQAQTGLLQQEAAHYGDRFKRKPQLIKTAQGFAWIDPITGEVSPVMAQGQQVKPWQTPGLQITGGPQGWTISQGGLTYSGPSQGQRAPGTIPSPSGGAPAQGFQPSNIIKSPGAPISRRSTAGSTLLDTNTGNESSVSTNQSVSYIQKGIAGEKALVPSLLKIYKDVVPLIGGKNWLQRKFKGLKNPWSDDPQFDRYTSGVKAQITNALEGMLRTYNINMSDKAQERVERELQPLPSDNKYSYARRMGDIIGGILYRSGVYKNLLRQGFSLSPETPSSNILEALSNTVYDQLINQPVTIPNFATSGKTREEQKAAFQTWFIGLDPSSKAKVRKQLAAQEAALRQQAQAGGG